MQSRRPTQDFPRRSISLERRRPFGDGNRSRSPRRGHPFGNWVTDRDIASPERAERRSRYEFFEYMDRKHDYMSPPRKEFNSSSIRDDRFETSRRFNRELSGQKPAGLGGLYNKPTSSNPETSGGLTAPSLTISGKERVHYPDVRDNYSFEKLIPMNHYGDEDKSMMMAHPRPDMRSKEPIRFRDYETASPTRSRIDRLDYRGSIPFPRDSSPRERIPEPLPHYRYEQKQHLDLHREINHDMGPYREDRFSPPRTAHLDPFRLQPRSRGKDDYLYTSDEIYEKMDLHERVDYNGRDVLKPGMLDRVTQRAEASDIAYRNMSSRRSLDRIPITVTSNMRLSRSPGGDKRASAQYLDTVTIHSRLGRKVSREDEMRYMQDLEIERARVDYESHKERMRSFQGFPYEREHRMEDRDPSAYDSSSRYLKRKYMMEDEEDRIPSRSMMSRLDYTVDRRHNHQDSRDEEWIDQDARRSNFSRRTLKVYDDEDDGFFYEPDEFIHDHHHKYDDDDKYAKGYSRSSVRVGHHPNRSNVVPRSNVEPHEGSKDFKELVNEYFLSFTKKLNENPVVRRRYEEQGRAGSLFCVVCGRSLSKEFLDTQRLAMHAFMSHKGGLRAQHLGLLKAICVMLGWNSIIPADTPRWFPETLSSTETWAQKQDLIIWPPVVIVHNISIINNSSNGEGPRTVDALGEFLRGIGLSGGKVKLGKPANCSIMLVKFLGTFSGLQDAEKIHEYFSKKKHGRKHLEQISSGKGKINRDESADERVLFGYMGIAEDLDKVDIDTKRKCSIKSKKEIQDIADAPVKPAE